MGLIIVKLMYNQWGSSNEPNAYHVYKRSTRAKAKLRSVYSIRRFHSVFDNEWNWILIIFSQNQISKPTSPVDHNIPTNRTNKLYNIHEEKKRIEFIIFSSGGGIIFLFKYICWGLILQISYINNRPASSHQLLFTTINTTNAHGISGATTVSIMMITGFHVKFHAGCRQAYAVIYLESRQVDLIITVQIIG